jgi:HAD superfamily hydrolase (TIGR01459 family)
MNITSGIPRLQACVRQTTVSDLAFRFDGFLIDLWGVVHDGRSLFGNAKFTLAQLALAQKRVIFLSNTSRRASSVMSMLDEIGLPRAYYADVVCAGEIAYHLIGPSSGSLSAFGGKAYVVGTQPDDDWVNSSDVSRTSSTEIADFVIAVGLSPIGCERQRILGDLARLAARDVPFICANPDRRVVVGECVHECVGMLADYYENCGGHVIWCGKPAALCFRNAIARLEPIPAERICVIGDSLETDIRGGNSVGITTILISEKGWPDIDIDIEIAPDLLMSSLRW